MSDGQERDELRKRIAVTERRLGELRVLEEQSREEIPHDGFTRASYRSKLLSEIEELDDALREDTVHFADQ